MKELKFRAATSCIRGELIHLDKLVSRGLEFCMK